MTLLVNPTPRYLASAAADGSGNVILFGGKTTANTSTPGFIGDSFKWIGSSWVQITGTLPPYRADAACFYDGTNVNIINGVNDSINLSDMWKCNSSFVWSQVSLPAATIPYAQPTTLRGAAGCYQSSETSGFIFGGATPYNRHYVLDTWSWASGAWTLLAPANNPVAVEWPAFASNSITAILFGGKNFDGPSSQCLSWNGTNWVNVATGIAGVNRPSARFGSSMVWDSSLSRFILFGGYTANGYVNDLWSMNPTGFVWSNITPSVSPSPRAFQNLVYSSITSSSLMFGGRTVKKVHGDTWLLSAGTWTQQ
jgi:hypothetical protein